MAVRCPGCGHSSGWEHSRYVREVADEAIGGRPVRISVSVRRLYCENSVCSRKTFVLGLGGHAASHGPVSRIRAALVILPGIRCRYVR
ncbi:transposase family protein [Streptomyces sp. NPDC005070]